MQFNSREEFLNTRKNKLGASDAPIIMGVSPFKTPYQLWQEKLGLIPDTIMTSAMKRGLDMEETARSCFESMTGIKTFSHRVTHPNHEWMIASLDGIDFNGDNIVEIKCPGQKDHDTAIHGFVPEKYIPQLQHQLECTGLTKVYYFSFDGSQGVILEVLRDDNYIKDMVKMESEFFRCLQELNPPELIDRDYIPITNIEWQKHSMELKEYQNKLAEFEDKIEQTKKKLINMTNGKNCKGNGVSVSNITRRGSVDYKSIPELKSVDLEKYRKSATTYWKVNVGK